MATVGRGSDPRTRLLVEGVMKILLVVVSSLLGATVGVNQAVVPHLEILSNRISCATPPSTLAGGIVGFQSSAKR